MNTLVELGIGEIEAIVMALNDALRVYEEEMKRQGRQLKTGIHHNTESAREKLIKYIEHL